MRRIYFLLIFYFYTSNGFEHEFLGCFKDIPKIRSKNLPQIRIIEECGSYCRKNYYRYYTFYLGDCTCGNLLGEQITNATCENHCLQECDRNITLTNVYATGNNVPGPPLNLLITNITSNSCRIHWKEPESYVNINGYVIKAFILKTFSNYPPSTPQWSFGNSTYQTEIANLLPATRYNFSVYTLSNEGDGATTYQDIVTKLGEPDNLPAQPTIISNNGETMKIKLTPTMNNNGPVSTYRIIVVKSDENQGFQKDNVLSYNEAQKNGLSYYVAAEINPQNVNKEFIIGDGKRYGPFYNAPLDSDVTYKVLVGLVSNFNGETKIVYSEASGYHNGISILNVYGENSIEGDSPGVIIGLSVAIGLLTFMLITGIIGFIILKSRIISRRQRLSENQELTLQGPMIEVENNGYIHEEDHIPAVAHYRNLKQRVRTIPSSQLKIEPTNLLGVGKYGKVNSGTLHENEALATVTCYSIYDKKMNQDTKRGMLQELDILIKTGKNENIINLIGTSETREMVVVVMEYASMNLKDLLLGSRDHLPGKFSNMTENQALEIAIGICKGMKHLHSAKIIHKQLCARSILISNGFTPKVGSYGLAQYFSHNKIPDYTRWTALEVFKGNQHISQSDVWSFACLLWEVVALGGTPYGNIPNNNEIPDNLSKGVRLPQLRYVSDDLYQIMLDCWQLIPDERPKFEDLLESLKNLKENNLIPALTFNIYSNFQYEQFYPDMELSVRPVF